MRNKKLIPIGCPQCREPIQNIQALRGHLVWKHDLRPSDADAIMRGELIESPILDKKSFLANNKEELDWLKE